MIYRQDIFRYYYKIAYKFLGLLISFKTFIYYKERSNKIFLENIIAFIYIHSK